VLRLRAFTQGAPAPPPTICCFALRARHTVPCRACQDLWELPAVSTTVSNNDSAALERELAVLFVESLNLETPADQIDPTASLFGDGLGLDSIDILEVALEVSQRYGFQLRSDDENNQKIFQNLRSLAAHVAQHRTK
jgi:acyl carrier protein